MSYAFELMHSRYQAELMADAVLSHPDAVAFCERTMRDERVGDFTVCDREFEIKTIQTLDIVERRRNGWTTAQVTARKLARDLRRKAKQGFQQIAAIGTVVCVVWCDFVGVVLADELAEFSIAVPDIFDGQRYVVGARNEVGRDLWFGFRTTVEWENALLSLEANLNRRRYASLPLGDPGVKFTTNAQDWMTTGRVVRIDGSRQHED